jgi:F-type H+-transporting ATPase subunit b
MNRTNALALLLSLATPALALAAGGPEAEHGPQAGAAATVKEGAVAAVATIVVFALVFAVLAVKVWPTIAGALDQRADKIKSEIEAAELARKQAKDALEEYQQSLQQARAEAQRMIDQAKSQQLAVAASEKAKLEAELTKERERALRDIEAAKKAAVGELYNQSAALATTLAGKILKRNITASDHQQLIDESLVQMQGLRN